MIKTLITDLAHDKITLAQGLTRTKLLQSKLKVEELRVWLTNELNGYQDKDDAPAYRKLRVSIIGDFTGPFGERFFNAPLDLTPLGKSLEIDFEEYVVLNSIKGIEDMVKDAAPDQALKVPFPQSIVRTLADLYRQNDPHRHLITAGSIITPNQCRNILDQTKQRLLDILLELQEKFHSMDDDFVATTETKEQARNIVNYYVYGGSNNANIGVGDNVVQSGITQVNKTKLEQLSKRLKKANVPEGEIEKIKVIIASDEKNDSKYSKAMKWISELSQKMIAKGVELKLPEIIEATENSIRNWNV